MRVRCCAVSTVLWALTGALFVSSALSQQPVARLHSVPTFGEARVALQQPGVAYTHGAETLGEVPATTALPGMSLVLKPSDAQDAALTQLLADQQNPASASYHQWLTPEQFGQRFGVAQADIALIESWLQANGFTVESVPASRNRIVFSGNASAVNSAFHAGLKQYRRNGRDFFENSTAVQLPASLAAVVGGVSGLSSYRLPAPEGKRATALATASPDYTTSTGGHYIVPADLRTIYGSSTLINGGFNGSGIKIGIIGQSAVDTQQLTYFQQKTGQTLNLPTMVLVPNTGNSNKVSGDEGESELDLEYAGGNAPGASVQFIYTGCTNTTSSGVLSASVNCNNNGVFDALAYAVTGNLAPILSLSYGACEEEAATYANSTLEPVLRQANAQGQTIMVSSGDAGAASCETSASTKVATAGLAVSYPASSPYVTGVGGTQLTGDTSTYWNFTNDSSLGSAISYVPETSWNDTAAYGALASSGGGVSQIFTKPSWQVGTGVPADGYRDVPDVAFPANVKEFAYLTCDADGPCTSGTKSFTLTGSTRDGGGVGGTSAAAPTFAGMLALVEQANGGKALGNINPSLYALAQGTSAATLFHDITTGNNIVNCTVGTPNCTTGTLGYFAGVGYDQVTGLGSIAISALQTALAGYAANVPRLQLGAPTTIAAGTFITFTVTAAGSGATPTGSVTFSVDGTAVGSGVALASGTASYTFSGFTSTGNHSVTAAYSGNGAYSAATASIVVNATIVTPTIALTASPTTIAVNTAATVTATLGSTSGTPTGTVMFSTDQGATSTVPVISGTASYPFAGFTSAGLHVVLAVFSPTGSGTGTSIYTSVQTSLIFVVTSPTQTSTPTLQVTLSATSVAAGGTFTASAQANGTGGTPTGKLLFQVDGVGSGTIVNLSNGSTFATTLTAPSTSGAHTVLATYYGDNTYKAATATATFTVATPGISVAVSPTTLTAAYGTTASGSLTVTSGGSAAGTTSIALSLVSYTGATFSGCYSLSPRTLNVPANSSATAMLTLYTTASSCTGTGLTPLSTATAQVQASASHAVPRTGSGFRFTAWAALPLPVLLLLVRRRQSLAGLLGMLTLVCCLGISGCGSGSSNSTTTTTGTGTGTTTTTSSGHTGSYVVRVTATTPSSTGTLSSNTTFTLNVQ